VAGSSGLLVPPDDPPALAAAIRQLLDDEAARKRLGAGAREAWRSQFTAERMQESYLDVFTGALR
jgi:rhamnosyl/mannosyltransferase